MRIIDHNNVLVLDCFQRLKVGIFAETINEAWRVAVITCQKNKIGVLSDEFLVTQDPDFILLAGYNSYAPGFVDGFSKNPHFQTLKAVKNKHVVVVDDAHISAVSQYIVDGVSDVAALLYPDVYQPTMTATEVATATP